ncbi:MAG TPA: hypothetical protein VLL52_19395, partial [Anaerolineae bacterium]|nr:hypothetical protein [Anaerolineae bacterium]
MDERERLVGLGKGLWRVYRRGGRPQVGETGDFPWDDEAFGERMLALHLDERHGAASRTRVERRLQIGWLYERLGLAAGKVCADLTCGPGLYAVPLAERGVQMWGIDISSVAVGYGREL